jgi:hypothetical protein
MWTDEMVSTLRKMWADGEKSIVIGLAVGKSNNAVEDETHA